jgi:hypothetical protein
MIGHYYTLLLVGGAVLTPIDPVNILAIAADSRALGLVGEARAAGIGADARGRAIDADGRQLGPTAETRTTRIDR